MPDFLHAEAAPSHNKSRRKSRVWEKEVVVQNVVQSIKTPQELINDSRNKYYHSRHGGKIKNSHGDVKRDKETGYDACLGVCLRFSFVLGSRSCSMCVLKKINL